MDEGFSDNWTYLRTELNWLDRMLAGAIARQQKEKKEVDRVSRARIDQITSHWWKGLIQVEGTIAGDSPAQLPRRSGTKLNYQQQLEAKIEASQRQGIVLGLPSLCQRLDLSPFEKNVVLLALAPEVSRRYGRIYNFLQETDHPTASGLPTIDLILRLLCRNDSEWRSARQSLSQNARLLRSGIVVLPQSATEPFLSHPVKLADAIAEFLLADTPQLATLDQLLQVHAPQLPESLILAEPWTEPLLDCKAVQSLPALPTPTVDLWQKLVLPDRLRLDLRHLGNRLCFATEVDATWGFAAHQFTSTQDGTIALLAGARGTGKTLVAQAIAQSLKTPCVVLNLEIIAPHQINSWLQQLIEQNPTVLLLKSAHRWFGRSSDIDASKLQQFWQTCSTSRTITLLSVKYPSQIKACWRSSLTQTLTFPIPSPTHRLQLWQQAFPDAAPLANDIDWQKLAKLVLTGGQIRAIAREAAIFAIAETSLEISMKHLLQAYNHLFKAKQRLR